MYLRLKIGFLLALLAQLCTSSELETERSCTTTLGCTAEINFKTENHRIETTIVKTHYSTVFISSTLRPEPVTLTHMKSSTATATITIERPDPTTTTLTTISTITAFTGMGTVYTTKVKHKTTTVATSQVLPAKSNHFTPILDTLPTGAYKKRDQLRSEGGLSGTGTRLYSRFVAAVRGKRGDGRVYEGHAEENVVVPSRHATYQTGVRTSTTPCGNHPSKAVCVDKVKFYSTTISFVTKTIQVTLSSRSHATAIGTAKETTTTIVPMASQNIITEYLVKPSYLYTDAMSTSTRTAIETVTVFVTGATDYSPVCDVYSRNYAGAYANNGFRTLITRNGDNSQSVPIHEGAFSAEACCRQCWANELCGAMMWVDTRWAGDGNQLNPHRCYSVIANDTSYQRRYTVDSRVPIAQFGPYKGYILSNGPNGRVDAIKDRNNK